MKIRNLLLYTLVLLTVASCKKKQVETSNIYRFKEYISYTTSGVVSTSDNIIITLAQEVQSWKDNDVISTNVFSISPKVYGKLKKINTHAFAFYPDEKLESNTEYTVNIKLNEIYKNVPKGFEEYTFQFKTIAPNISIQTEVLQSYSKDYQYIKGTLKSADVIDLSQAKKIIKAFQKGVSKSIVFDESYQSSKVFEFKIDSIQRFVEDSKVDVFWNGKIIQSNNKGEHSIVIPGKNQFKIIDVSLKGESEPYLSINFSDGLKKQQNFDGLIKVQNEKKPRFIVNGNELKVFSETSFTNDTKVSIFPGVRNSENYRLQEQFSKIVAVELKKPEIRAISNGTILPNSSDLKFNFEAINVKEVDVRIIKIFEDNVLQFLQEQNLNSNDKYAIKRVGRRVAKQTIKLIKDNAFTQQRWRAYSVDLSKIISIDPGAIYRIELSFNKNQVICNCNEPSENNNENNSFNEIESEDTREELYWDNKLYSYRNYNYNWRQRDNPCHEAYYNEDRIIAQNLLGSNLGVIVKKGLNNEYFFAVTNILSTNPESSAQVSLYNFQQQEIAKGVSNSEGIATIETSKNAAFAIVSKGNYKAYVRLFDGNSLSLSKFDVSGSKTQKGLKGFLYGERGVWRPGDEIHLTFILNDADNKLPKNHPVKLEVTDPRGKLIYKKVTAENVNKFYKFTLKTNQEAQTGNYTAKVSVGGAKFYKTLKVETVKPNRLKIKIDFGDEALSNREPIKGNLNVKWLHGTPAKNLKAAVKAKISTSYTAFKDYKGYIFSDPSRTYNTEELNIFEGQLNELGEAKISKNLKVGKNAPGMLNIQFLVRAFENGGDFSIDAFTKKYAPYSTFVGLQSPKGNQYGSFFTDENLTFSVVSVDENGKPKANKNLEVEVYQIQWRWWWSSSHDNLSKYTSSSYHKPYQSLKIKTNNEGKSSFNLNIPEEDRGRFLIRVIDKEGGHATGRTAYFYKNWWMNSSSGDKEAAKMLVFSADKEKYNVGEIAKITFPSSNEGRALLSIENGSKVLKTQWIKTTKGTTTATIKINKNMAPNVFVNISLLQPHQATENDLPIRLYGVIPLLIEDNSSILEPVIDMPKTLKPEKEFTVQVSEKNNKAMTYTLAVVEEGLLDLTRFKTPNPHKSFFTREALGVKTWDIFDDVIGAYSGSIDQVFAIGGDGSLAKGKNKKANRFKPVVTYLGPFTLKKGEQKTHNITLPNYIGSVRTMVVAGNINNESFGNTEETTPVKKPLMVLATLPRKLSPKEKVTLPISVFAMDKKVKNVTIQVKTLAGIQVIGNNSKTINFEKPDEKMVYFNLDVLEANGINSVEVIATGAGEKATCKVELDVVNPNPITSKIIDGVVQKNGAKIINFNTFGVTDSNSAVLELSTIPNLNFTGRLAYLIQYPHGCVEQTTSSVLPQLYLNDLFDLSASKKKEIQKNIEKGIKRLGNFQKAGGGLSYWIGENYVSDWGTTYAGHFMLEAEKKGFVLPLTFKTNFINYQKQAARNWEPSYTKNSRDFGQAYRLYTLALAGAPDLSAMNRLREYKQISNEALWRLAAAYALVGQKEAALKIMEKATYNFAGYKAENYGSIPRNKAMALETLLLLKSNKAREIAESIAKELSSKNWMSTQTTAYCLLSIGKFVVKNGGKSMDVQISSTKDMVKITTSSSMVQRTVDITDGNNSITIKNKNDNVVYARIINSGKLPLGNETIEQRGFHVKVVYKDLQGKAIDVSSLKQGQDFIAQLSVTNPKNEGVKDIALTQIFPSGWEIVNTRFTDFGSTTKSEARYTDIKDDRVNFYFDIHQQNNKAETKTFSVLLNAAYLGKFYLPGIQVEAMYDHDYLVRTKGRWIEVVK